MRHPAVLLLMALGACAPSTTTTTPAPVMPAVITPAELRRDLHVIAADSFLGRETGTPASLRAASFLASRLTALGLEPAGDSMYHHRVPLVRQTFAPETRFTVQQTAGSATLALGADVVPLMNLGPGAPLPKRNADGDIVFAGYGMTTHGRDDFQGLNAAGKVLVMLHAAPPAVTDTASRKQLEGQDELGARLMRALQLQPAAIVLLMTGGTAEFYDQAAPELVRTVTLAPGDRSTSDSERPLPMVLLGRAKAGSPLLPTTWPADDAPQALTGRRLSAHIAVRQEPFTAYNVVGIIRGSDPRLNKTYVALGAHYDHSGVVSGMTPDSILNGADDDGSGTVTTLAVAKSLSVSRPRRSVLVVLHTAEEKGLFGSGQYAGRPTVPIDSIVAMINMDMVGRRGGPTAQWDTRVSGHLAENRLYIVGPAAAPNEQSRVLGAIADSVNARQIRPLEFDRTWDDPAHPERIYYRSDHFPYANKGIPVLFFTTGLHEDYHKPSDEPDKIDYEKMSRIAAMIAELAATLGNRETRPR